MAAAKLVTTGARFRGVATPRDSGSLLQRPGELEILLEPHGESSK